MKSKSKESNQEPVEEKASSEKRLQPMIRALKAVHSSANSEEFTLADLEKQRKGQQLLGRLMTPMIGMEWETFDLDEMPMAWTRLERVHDTRRVVLYCHGGGYTSGSLEYARILSMKISYITGYEVCSFAYRLAPEYRYPAALNDALAAWDHLMYLGYGAQDIILAGDSAGGNLALCLALKLKEQNRRLPCALVLLSPWTDMTSSGKSYTENADVDPILSNTYIRNTRNAYAPDVDDYSAPFLSPLFGDLKNLPPVLIQVGSNEILLSDSVRLKTKLIKAGVSCQLEVWNGMWHVFQSFPMRQATEALENIGRFILGLP